MESNCKCSVVEPGLDLAAEESWQCISRGEVVLKDDDINTIVGLGNVKEDRSSIPTAGSVEA
jgi:hypothetical protein